MDGPGLEIGGDRTLGGTAPCFLIAEIGMNHNGDWELAQAMIDAAADAGADAVKFQMFSAEHFVSRSAMVYGEDRDTVPARQIDMLRPLEFTEEEWQGLKRHAESREILFFATPLDAPSVDQISALETALIKVASCDVNNPLLIRRIAALQRPTILSTGMATLSEIEQAVEAFDLAGGRALCLMQCVSSYPAALEDANVRTIPALAARFGLPVGFSDHCKENAGAFAAAALGAAAIEKHFTTDNNLPGVDQRMSLNPSEFADMVRTVRQIEAALGDARKRVLESEGAARAGARRSLHAARDFAPGEIVTEDMLVAKRPASGIPPGEADRLIGRRVVVAVEKDAMLARTDLD